MPIASQIPESGIQREWTSSPSDGYLARIIVAWEAFINFLAPFGYEDENGFHYEEEPASKKSTYRST